MKVLNNNKLKLLIIVLVFFSCLLLFKSKSTYGIYRDTFNTQIYLSVLDPERTYTITLHAGDGQFENGTNTKSFAKTVHEPVGKFETPTNPGYNFVGWYTAATDGTKIDINEPVEEDIDYYAHWAKVVCKKAPAGTQHINTCYDDTSVSGTDYGCHRTGRYANGDSIEYGIIPETDSPLAGYAYDCDVNDDGTFDSLTERFYYVREIDETLSGGVDDAVLVHYTSFDENGQVTYAANSHNRKIYQYDDGKAYLPNSTTWPTNDAWDNPALVGFDGKVARYINLTDLKAACGDLYANNGLLDNCQFFMEISRFESDGVGRSGLWLEQVNNKNRRIDSRTRNVSTPADTSENSVRPVIEIPYNTLEGYKEREIFDVTFVSNGGTTVNHRQRYEDQPIGELTRSLRDGYTFRGWYYDNGTFLNEASASDLVSSNVKLYAKWEEWTDNMEYVFHIPGTCTFGGNSNNITSASDNCISTVNPSGSNIDYTATANKYIDTNISLYDSTNYNKDYEIGFTIQAYNSSVGDTQATFVSSKVETDPNPGMVVRRATNASNQIEVSSTVGTEKLNDVYKHTNPITSSNPMNVVIARRNGIIYYSLNGEIFKELSDLSALEPDLFNMNTWFGATVVGGTKTDTDTSSVQRYLTGTLSNLYIKLESEPVETVQVNFNGHDATTLEFASKTVNKGGYIGTLPAVTKTGYRFNGWFTEATDGRQIDETEVINTNGLTFHAQYTPLVLVTFETDGGTLSISPNTVEVPVGETIGSVLTNNTLPTVTKTGKVFIGWYTTATTGGRQIDETEVINDVTSFYARYVDEVTLTFNGNGATPSYASKTVGAGLPIDELPTVSMQGYDLVGWFVDDGNGNPSSTQIQVGDSVNADTTLVAKWVDANHVAMIGNDGYATLAEAIEAVPTGKVKTTITILKDIETETVTIPNTKYVELDIGEYTITGNLTETDYNIIINQGKLDIISGTISSSDLTIKNYLITNVANAELNIYDGVTLENNCYVAGATTEFIAISNNGTVNIYGGNITSYGQSATINQNAGTLNVSGGSIIAHSVTKGQAIYIAGGTVNISGDCHIENTSGSDPKETTSGTNRAAVDQVGGTLNITGGTIVSNGWSAVIARANNKIVTIGTDDSVIDITTPVLRGKRYGLEIINNPTVRVYDGIFESADQTPAISTTTVTKPDGVDFNTSGNVVIGGVTYHTAHLIPPQITINFYEETNGTAIPVTVDTGSTIGNLLPTPNPKQGYYFAGWFIDGNPLPVTSDTTVTGPFNAYAKWVQSVSEATFNRTMNIQLNDTATITFEEDDIEDVEYTTSDSSVATVDADGTVHAVGLGEATITLTGSLSGDSETVTVTVTQIMYTVSFYDEDYDPNDLENSTLFGTVQVASGSSVAAGSMPTPTNANYVLSDWYINGNSATPLTSETTVTGDMVVVANWKEKVSYATLTKDPNPLNLIIGNTGQITLSATEEGDTLEDFTVTSSNPSAATVSKNGNVITVTAVGVGDTTITITGSLSNTPVTALVSVDVLKYTVTFKDGNTPIDSVQVVANGTVGEDMPADPTKTNYIFNGWVYDYQNNLTPFTSEVTVSGNIDVFASWKEQINIATLPDDPITILLGADKQIIVTATGAGNLVEDYTLSSSNTNYVEVNGKTITGASLGSVTLTIEGVTSHRTRTITVNVVNSHSVTFDPDNGDTSTVIQVEVGSSIDDSGETLPSDPTKTGYVFDNWYLYDDVNKTLTDTRLDTTATVTADTIYKAKWVDDTYKVVTYTASGPVYKTTLQAAFNEAPTSGVETEVKILQNIDNPSGQTKISGGRSIILNGGNYSVTCGASTTNQMIFNEGGTLRVISGTYSCGKDKLATIENAANCTTIIEGGLIENTNNRGAIFNNGIVEIKGGTLTSVAPERGVVQNANGTAKIIMSGGTVKQLVSSTLGALHNGKSGSSITITGGTVTSVGNAIQNINGTTLTVGTENSAYNVTTPVIQGDKYGITSTVNYSVYDGIIKGKEDSKAVNDFAKITGTETNSTRQTGTDGDYYTLYYEMPQEKYRINFNPGAEGTVSPSYLDYQLNTAINGSNFPTPTRANYNFDGWYTDSGLQTPATTPFTPTATDEVTYYAKWSSTYRINFNPGTDGSVTPTYIDYPLNTAIDGSNFPTPTRANYTFVGWYTDSNTQTAFTSFTPTAYGETIYYAKWAYASSLTPVSHNILSPAMQEYFSNVSSWVTTDATDPSNAAEPYKAPQTKTDYNNGHNLFKSSIDQVFTDNGCSACGENNACGSPRTGTYCDQPGEYDTGLTDNLNVYLYENGEKGSQVTYVTSTGGKIYNMIPGETYLWESATDATKYGVVTATGSRRTLKTAVRNLRDLGGLSASNSDVSGTIDYGRLYRGAQITSAQGVTDLTKLGVTREVDLRANGDGTQSYKMTNYDTGTSSSYTDIVMTNYIVNPEATLYITNAHMPEYRNVKASMRAIMEKVVFNHDSIFFHCTIGTDRTGTMAYFLEGLLGVSEEDRLRDYEMTYFFGLTNRTRFHDTSGWSNTAPRFYSMYRSYPSNTDIYNYFTQYEPHTVDPNDPNDLTDAELVRRFRLELIH